MKGRTIILDHFGDVEAAALMVDGKLMDLIVDGSAPRPGTIYRAVSERPVKGLGGVFVRTPDGMAFLRQKGGSSPPRELLVQVTGYAEPGKAIPVTSKLLFKSRYAIVTPDAPGLNVSRSIKDEQERDRLLMIAHGVMAEEGFGLIMRSACAHAGEDDIAEDITALTAAAHAVVGDKGASDARLLVGDGPHIQAWRDWTQTAKIVTMPGGFEREGILDVLDKEGTGEVSLGGGAKMFVEPTRALVAVDINTGSDTSGAAGLKANVFAARELPRALRVLGLGGQITLDLAPMPKKDRKQFEIALSQAFRGDDIDTSLVGWTPLGNFELQRKRARVPFDPIIL